MEQQKQSQLSIKQFCEDNGISYQTFFYWSKRLRSPETVQSCQRRSVPHKSNIGSMCCNDTFRQGLSGFWFLV
ncbi:IS66 family insertion sequence element accessory protein TnpA [Vibrio sp. Vb1729]|uniref:IS66 family insertion sequence element accessory protein TnpA n=1 Tax=Vibrio sp. Vb1729 TaxID=3074644 RepID=UPI00398C7FE2